MNTHTSAKTLTRKTSGDWLSVYQWFWFFYGTFRYPPKSDDVCLHAFRCWVDQLRRRGLSPYYFVVVERRDQRHVHALLGNIVVPEAFAAGARRWARDRWWVNGRADLVPYDPSRGGCYYLTKCFGTDRCQLDLGGPWPRKPRFLLTAQSQAARALVSPLRRHKPALWSYR